MVEENFSPQHPPPASQTGITTSTSSRAATTGWCQRAATPVTRGRCSRAGPASPPASMPAPGPSSAESSTSSKVGEAPRGCHCSCLCLWGGCPGQAGAASPVCVPSRWSPLSAELGHRCVLVCKTLGSVPVVDEPHGPGSHITPSCLSFPGRRAALTGGSKQTQVQRRVLGRKCSPKHEVQGSVWGFHGSLCFAWRLSCPGSWDTIHKLPQELGYHP